MAAASGDRAVCAVTLYSPYWLDNRTGLDLDFQVGAQGSERISGFCYGRRLSMAMGTAHTSPCTPGNPSLAVDVLVDL